MSFGGACQVSGNSESLACPSRLETGVASEEGMFGTILHLWPDLPGGVETHQWSTGELRLTDGKNG